MEQNKDRKNWTKPVLVVHGNVQDITKGGGSGWKTNGVGDDLVSASLTPWQSCCC